MNAFDSSLKGLDTSKEGTVVQTSTSGGLDLVARGGGKYVGKKGLYACFVRGEGLNGTLHPLKSDGLPTPEESEVEDKMAAQNGCGRKRKREEETKEERRARKSAKKTSRVQKLKSGEQGSESVETSSDDKQETKEERRARRAAKKASKQQKDSNVNASSPDESGSETKDLRRVRKSVEQLGKESEPEIVLGTESKDERKERKRLKKLAKESARNSADNSSTKSSKKEKKSKND